MTERAPLEVALAVLDELERRRRRDFDQARSLLLRVLTGQEGSISSQGFASAHTSAMRSLLLDIDDCGDELQVSPATVKRLIRSGELPAVKVGRTTRVRRADLEEYVARLGDDAPSSSDRLIDLGSPISTRSL